MSDFEDFFFRVFLVIIMGSVAGLLIYTPIASYQSAQVTQKALNEQCGTDYSVMDVLLSGEQLQDLCKMKNQQLLIKQ